MADSAAPLGLATEAEVMAEGWGAVVAKLVALRAVVG